MKAKKPRIGRPPLAPGEAKGTIFSVRLTPEERAVVESAAERAGEKASAWARHVLLRAARGQDQAQLARVYDNVTNE
jgi:hypothetical protein